MAKRYADMTDAELRERFEYIQGRARARIERDITKHQKALKKSAAVVGIATVGGILYGLFKRRSR